MPPDGVTDIAPLFCPHVGCVGVAEAVTAVEAPTVTVAVLVQAGLPEPVTVTVYVPAGTFEGFWPLRPPVQLYE